MATLEVNKDQLRLIQRALDLYSRIGIGQFGVIKDHPTFERHLSTELKDEDGKTDYGRYHKVRDSIDSMLIQPRNMLIQEPTHPQNGSWGIHNSKVDESCREAYDIIQVIRHEFWKADKDRSDITVDSSVHLTTEDTGNIKVTL
jgi:hypothetical protein